MRWPRRGILIRLFIYVPLIAVLAWRAQGGCGEEVTMEPESDLERELAPHRRVITLPDGTQQQIVEVTPEQAEAILGRPISNLEESKPKAGADGAPSSPRSDEGAEEGKSTAAGDGTDDPTAAGDGSDDSTAKGKGETSPTTAEGKGGADPGIPSD